MTRHKLQGRTDVDHHRAAVLKASFQLFAGQRFRGHPRDPGSACASPCTFHDMVRCRSRIAPHSCATPITRQPVEHARAVPTALVTALPGPACADDATCSPCSGRSLRRRPRPRASLGQQVNDLGPPAARQRLGHAGLRPEERLFRRSRPHRPETVQQTTPRLPSVHFEQLDKEPGRPQSGRCTSSDKRQVHNPIFACCSDRAGSKRWPPTKLPSLRHHHTVTTSRSRGGGMVVRS